ncbi:MAG: nuclear transport factor 2 family protein [Ktedonobacterales bacterium]
MTESNTPVAIARAFTQAWTGNDMERAADYLAEEIVFDGPMGHVEGKKAYIESLKGLIGYMGITGAQIVVAFGDGAQALLMYELNTTVYGALTCAKLLTFHNGKIQRDRLTFDSYVIRKGQGA